MHKIGLLRIVVAVVDINIDKTNTSTLCVFGLLDSQVC